MSVTVICAFKRTKRARYCDRSFVAPTFTAAVLDFALHSVAEHGGKMVGEVLNTRGRRFTVRSLPREIKRPKDDSKD